MGEPKCHEVSSGGPAMTPESAKKAPDVDEVAVGETPPETSSKQVGLEFAVTGERRGGAKKTVKACRVPGCNVSDLSNSSRYCLRHRICEAHFKVCRPVLLRMKQFLSRGDISLKWCLILCV